MLITEEKVAYDILQSFVNLQYSSNADNVKYAKETLETIAEIAFVLYATADDESKGTAIINLIAKSSALQSGLAYVDILSLKRYNSSTLEVPTLDIADKLNELRCAVKDQITHYKSKDATVVTEDEMLIRNRRVKAIADSIANLNILTNAAIDDLVGACYCDNTAYECLRYYLDTEQLIIKGDYEGAYAARVYCLSKLLPHFELNKLERIMESLMKERVIASEDLIPELEDIAKRLAVADIYKQS